MGHTSTRARRSRPQLRKMPALLPADGKQNSRSRASGIRSWNSSHEPKHVGRRNTRHAERLDVRKAYLQPATADTIAGRQKHDEPLTPQLDEFRQ